MPDTTHTSAHTEIETLRADIRQLQVDLAGLTNSVRGVVRARVNDTAGKAWSEAKGIAEKLAHEVEEKPVTAMASAFVIGILLGVVTSRRT